jgi:hypothetical protein
VQPDEICVATLSRGGNQYIDELGQLRPDVVAAQRRRPGDDAARAGVQQRGHLLLQGGRRTGRGHVHPGQQPPPRPAQPEPVCERMLGQARSQRLLARDHV